MEVLEKSIKILCSSMDLDNEQRFHFLSKFLDENDPEREVLKKELEDVLGDPEFDLRALLAENDELIQRVEIYDRRELESYLKMWLWEYLYPDAMLTKDQLYQLRGDVVSVLKGYSEDDGWMFSYDLYHTLRESDKYSNLEYHHLWKLGFSNVGIERKPIPEKYQEIGFLRYKGSI